MSKKFPALLLAVCLTLALAAPAFAADFTDTADHWAEDSIARWAEHGIIEGIGNNAFDPDGSMTRAQAAVLFAKLLKLNTKGDLSKFDDVNPDAWYAEYIALCVGAGILNGVGDDAMDPNGTLTREQMMTMLCRAVGIKPEATSEKTFADSNKVSDWAEGYVNALTNAGIVHGVTENTVAPAADINRASMMALLDKGISTYADTAGETVEAKAEASGIVLVAAPNVTVTGTADSVAVVEGAAGGTTTLKDANVGSVTLTAANTDVVLGGSTKAENVELTEKAEGSSVKVEEKASAGEVNAAAPETSVKVEGAVENVTVSDTAANTIVETGDKATVGKVDTAAEGTTVSGTGKVENVATSGNNTTVETGGTKVEAAEGTTGTTAGGEAVEGGSSVTTTEPVQPSTPSTPVTPPAPPAHSHSYTYTSNNDGTHNGACECGEDAITNEACGDWVEGSVCEKCGFNKDAAAVIGTTYYATLAEALAVGGEVKLLKDVTLTASAEIPEGKTVALDLNGFDVIGDWNGESTTNHIYAIYNYGTFTVNDSSEPSTGAIVSRGIYNYGTMTLNSGTIDACDANGGYAINGQTGSSFTMTGGAVITSYEDGDAPAAGYDATTIKVPSGATATISGGTISNVSNYTYAIDNSGTMTISGGTVTSIHSTVSNSGTMTISGGSFTCNGLEGITAHALVAWEDSVTTISGGTFNGKDNYNGFNVDATVGATVTITGGTFEACHSGSLYGEGTITVSGGIFFDNPSARLASGYKAVENNGDWTVEALDATNSEAKIGTTYYATLAEAVAVGGEITLLKNVELTEGLTVSAGKTVTLNLNGYDITAAINVDGGATGVIHGVFKIETGASLTVNGSGDVTLNVKVKNNGNVGTAIFYNMGDLVINDGNYLINDSTDKAELPAGPMVINTIVDNCLYAGEASTTINGGTYQLNGYANNLFRNYPTGTDAQVTLTINAGTFNKNPAKEITYIWNHQNNASSKAFMNFVGGTYNGIVYEDYHGQSDITVSAAATSGGLTAYAYNS